MKILKVLHVTFDMAIGGAEQVIRQLVENTDRSRYDPSILCLDGKIGELGLELVSKGYEVAYFSRQTNGLDSKLIRNLRDYVQENQIDILHCHQYTPYTYGLFASFRTKAAVIFTEHGRFYPDSFKWKRVLLNPILSLKTAAVTTISRATAEALVRYENFPSRKIKVIYNGISDIKNDKSGAREIRDELGIVPGDQILGSISRLDPIKNQKMMISAFKNVLKTYPSAKLLLVGDGPIRSNLEEYAAALNVSARVIFTGFKVNPQRYLEIMDIFLLSSLSEGTSMTVLEAMAFSKPCVVTDVGGNPEILAHGETGLVTPSDNADKFSENILKLLGDQELQDQLGRAARISYEKSFTIDKMACSYHEIYSNAVRRHDP